MHNDFSTLKKTNLYFPKLHVIKSRKKKNLNCFLKRNNNYCFNNNFDTSDEKLKTNYFIKNSLKYNNENYPQTPPNTLRYQIQNRPINFSIRGYTYRQHFNEVNKNNINKNNITYRTLSKDKINIIYTDLLQKKKNSKLISQGIVTSDSFYKRNKSKINFRNLSLGKDENNLDNLSSFNNDAIKELYNTNRKSKLTKKKFPLIEVVSNNILKDKYAYIYMSDKSELIKYWRRINYNPLNV